MPTFISRHHFPLVVDQGYPKQPRAEEVPTIVLREDDNEEAPLSNKKPLAPRQRLSETFAKKDYDDDDNDEKEDQDDDDMEAEEDQITTVDEERQKKVLQRASMSAHITGIVKKSSPVLLAEPATTTAMQDPHQHQHQHVIDIPTVSIWTAAEQGDLDSLMYYIQHSHDPVALLNKRDPKTECTLLHLVVSHVSDPYQATKLLLANGADPWARNVYNVQILHTLPLYCAHPRECLELLLSYPDLDINSRDGDGWTPLHYASRFCPAPLPIIELLVGHGADVNAVDASQKSPLFCLLANGDHVMALSFFVQGPPKVHLAQRADFLDPRTRQTYQGTLILQAAKYLRLACLQWLIQHTQAMAQLRTVLSLTEIDRAIHMVNAHPTHRHQKSMLDALHGLKHDLQEVAVTSTSSSSSAAVTAAAAAAASSLLPVHALSQHVMSRTIKDPSISTSTSGKNAFSSSRHQTHTSPSTDDHRRLSLPLWKRHDEPADMEKRPTLIKRMASVFTRYRKPSIIQEQMV